MTSPPSFSNLKKSIDVGALNHNQIHHFESNFFCYIFGFYTIFTSISTHMFYTYITPFLRLTFVLLVLCKKYLPTITDLLVLSIIIKGRRHFANKIYFFSFSSNLQNKRKSLLFCGKFRMPKLVL